MTLSEAFHAYEEYRNLRMKFGERITKNSPILLRRFDISHDGKTAKIENTRPVALSTIAGIMSSPTTSSANALASNWPGKRVIVV